MERQDVIDLLNDHLNVCLQTGTAPDDQFIQPAASLFPELIAQILHTYRAALQPSHFHEAVIQAVDARFEQAYELMRQTFSPDVLDSREFFARFFEKPAHSGGWLIGRYWQVSGAHRYDAGGRLVSFHFDPLCATEGIASVINGVYMSHGDGTGMGAIAYLASRPNLRRGGGHGRTLTALLERRMAEYAASRGEQLKAIVLESEAPARPFWYKMGYRWPQNSRYVQPPIYVDPDSGEPLSPAVPELFMIKLITEGDVPAIDREMLIKTVRRMYQGWYLGPTNNAEAQARLERLVLGELLGDFIASLPEGDTIPLGAPPLA